MRRPSKKTTLGAVILAVGLGAGTLLGRYLFYPNAVGSLATPDFCDGLGISIIPKLLPGSPTATANWQIDTGSDGNIIASCDVQTPDGDVFMSATGVFQPMSAWKNSLGSGGLSLKDATAFKAGNAAESWQNDADTFTYCNKGFAERPQNIAVTVRTKGSARGSGQEHRRLIAQLATVLTYYARTYCTLKQS